MVDQRNEPPDSTTRPFFKRGPDGKPVTAGEDTVAIEEPLEIRVNGEIMAITMRTPGHDDMLATGFLFAEGIIQAQSDIVSLEAFQKTDCNTINIVVQGDTPRQRATDALNKRGTLSTSACGVCGRKSIDDLINRCTPQKISVKIPGPLISQAMVSLASSQNSFTVTGGTHAAIAIDAEGHILAASEDVGRHNAVDKVIGALVFQEMITGDNRAVALAVSGRVSFEIVQKVAMARIPIVAGVSAASSLAIDLADRFGVTLAAFARGNQWNIYTHEARII